jgi:alpha-glucosidase
MNNEVWWQRGIIYQIYPLSYMDSNGDGYGDLPGIMSRLDYLQWLGVGAIWLSPIYPSPMADFGYDISDYTAIHPFFGSMADFDRLLAASHARGLKLILDFVPNHTSDRHPWFIESRSSRDSPKRNWYIWQDMGPDGEAPNNWLSFFGGSAWEWDEESGQYYYHAYLKEQPDLNWRNPEVQHAMFQVMRFWLDKGVDGFRLDALPHLLKDKDLRDNPPNPDYQEGETYPYKRLLPVYDSNLPEIHVLLTRIRQVLDEYSARLLIGEIYLPINELVNYYGLSENEGINLPYNFQLIQLPWKAADIFAGINKYEASLPPFGWPSWVLGNHDKSRVTSRLGPAQARIAAILLLTLRGTPTMYYGDELGMEDVPIPPDLARDPVQKHYPDKNYGRDPARTPMQWNAEKQAGFSPVKTWLPLPDNYRQVNVERAKADPASLLNFYHRLIQLRQGEHAFRLGKYIPVTEENNILAFIREYEGKRWLVAVNMAHGPASLPLPEKILVTGEIVFSTSFAKIGQQASQRLVLGPDEGIIIHLK